MFETDEGGGGRGGREGGGRDGKLGGHIKTARGHRCWIIWKKSGRPAQPPARPHGAELETDRKPRCRPRAPAFTPTPSPLVRLEVSLKGLMSQKGTQLLL